MKIFDLELASPCNASCSFCPQNWFGVKRDTPFIDAALLDNITREIGDMARDETVHAVFCGMGENLLRKPLLFRALENLERFSDGAVTTTLVTNGARLTPDLLENDAFRRLDGIQVSITGMDPDKYEEVYGLKHAPVVENITAMAKAMPGKVYIRSIEFDREEDRQEHARFVAYWSDRGVEVTSRPLHSRGGHLDDPRAYRGAYRQFKGCGIFNLITFISSDGKVLSCCHDVRSEHVVGDCRTTPLKEIIAEKQKLQAGDFKGYEICTKCTDFELSAAGLFEPPPSQEHAL
ncbi:radical SAM/SPASM domain-containing protein [Gymnodinialimonas sp.]